MKSKNLKSYDVYEKEHIKENINSLYTTPNTSKFNSSEENLEDIKEFDEEVESSTNLGDEEHFGIGTEEEKHINIPTHIELSIETIVDTNCDSVLPISEPVETNSFDPKKENIAPHTFNTDGLHKMFSVVKIMTQNGEKIGMCYTDEVGEYGTPIHNNLDFNSACEMVKQCCVDCGVSEFSNENDTIIGLIPTFMISKKNKGLGGSCSYIPSK